MSILTLRAASFAYDRSDKYIFNNLDLAFGPGWSGLVGSNGCGKSTLLRVLAGELVLSSGDIQGKSLLPVYCRQETTDAPKELADFQEAYDRTAIELKTALGLHELPGIAWHQLSNGEQKRFQLACALWARPDLLLVDEPTNHLDAHNRAFIEQALRQYKGIGILVSHDRQLLNALCRRCVFFVGGKTYDIAGNYERAKAELSLQFASVSEQRSQMKQKATKLRQESERLSQLNQGAKTRLSKKGIDRKDHDAKGRIDAARLTGKDASFGQKKLNLDHRVQRLQGEMAELVVNKDYSGPIFFQTELRPNKVLLHLRPHAMPLPNGQKLHLPELVIKGGSKVGLVGLNGVGKSSFLNWLLANDSFKPGSYLYLKQELSAAETTVLRQKAAALDSEAYARCLQIIARLGSEAAQMIKSERWSAGEARKLALALAIVEGVELLILDEPTNHLDLPTIQSLETALQESNLAVLLVSHDHAFIHAICQRLWQIEKEPSGDSRLQERDVTS